MIHLISFICAVLLFMHECLHTQTLLTADLNHIVIGFKIHVSVVCLSSNATTCYNRSCMGKVKWWLWMCLLCLFVHLMKSISYQYITWEPIWKAYLMQFYLWSNNVLFVRALLHMFSHLIKWYSGQLIPVVVRD